MTLKHEDDVKCLFWSDQVSDSSTVKWFLFFNCEIIYSEHTNLKKNVVFPTKKLKLLMPINVTKIKLKKAIIDLPHTFSKRKKKQFDKILI